MQVVTIPPIGIASHDLRRRLAEGRSVRYQVPRGVEAYIEAHGLYRPARDLGRTLSGRCIARVSGDILVRKAVPAGCLISARTAGSSPPSERRPSGPRDRHLFDHPYFPGVIP